MYIIEYRKRHIHHDKLVQRRSRSAIPGKHLKNTLAISGTPHLYLDW